jgi:hypothetical protein
MNQETKQAITYMRPSSKPYNRDLYTPTPFASKKTTQEIHNNFMMKQEQMIPQFRSMNFNKKTVFDSKGNV